MSQPHPVATRYARHVNPSFVKLLGVLGYGRVFVRARDVWVWDSDERRYLDFLAAFGAINIGHNHPALVRRLHAHLDEDAVAFCHIGPPPRAAELAERLAGLLPAPLEIVLFSSSGAEAVDAAMKLARAATRRAGFIYAHGGFHGTSMSALSIMGDPRLRRPFEPLLGDCTPVPFGDVDALAAALRTRRAAAFIVEPILGEGGVILPPRGYLAAAHELCRRHGTLLVFDEIQTGLGRTGGRFAFEAENVVPDMILLAKALSGGVAPIAATVASRELHERGYGGMDRFDLHGSTFAGNALSCVAALATLEILEEEKLAENARVRGEELLHGLRARLAGHPMVREIRGRGLLVGLELGPPADGGLLSKLTAPLVQTVSERVFGQWAALKLLEKGIICQPATHHWNVLKLEPPLTIAAPEIRAMIDAVGEIFDEYHNVPRLVADVALRVSRQTLRGFTF